MSIDWPRQLEEASALASTCEMIAAFTTDGYERFRQDVRTQWAVEMGLIRIGESARRLHSEVLDRFPDQPWREIIGLRNFTAHQYEDLEPRRVWNTITRDVPALRQYVRDRVLPALRARAEDAVNAEENDA